MGERPWGRDMAIVFCDDMNDGLVKRVNTETLSMQQELLRIVEVLQTVGGLALPPDPVRAAVQT